MPALPCPCRRRNPALCWQQVSAVTPQGRLLEFQIAAERLPLGGELWSDGAWLAYCEDPIHGFRPHRFTIRKGWHDLRRFLAEVRQHTWVGWAWRGWVGHQPGLGAGTSCQALARVRRCHGCPTSCANPLRPPCACPQHKEQMQVCVLSAASPTYVKAAWAILDPHAEIIPADQLTTLCNSARASDVAPPSAKCPSTATGLTRGPDDTGLRLTNMVVFDDCVGGFRSDVWGEYADVVVQLTAMTDEKDNGEGPGKLLLSDLLCHPPTCLSRC